MSAYIRTWLMVIWAAGFAWALLPMALVAGVVLFLSSASGARIVRSLDPVFDARRGVGRSLSVYEPSRMEVVDAVMELLALGEDDVLVDVGAGDGRFVVSAARAGATAIGVERQGPLVVRARDNAGMAGVGGRAAFLHADVMTVPSVVSRATVVTMFLTPAGFEILIPWLESVVRPGTRIVSHTWPVPGWRPYRVVLVDDASGRPWPVYLYRAPAADQYVRAAHRGS